MVYGGLGAQTGRIKFVAAILPELRFSAAVAMGGCFVIWSVQVDCSRSWPCSIGGSQLGSGTSLLKEHKDR
jgi:hypothetical protein